MDFKFRGGVTGAGDVHRDDVSPASNAAKSFSVASLSYGKFTMSLTLRVRQNARSSSHLGCIARNSKSGLGPILSFIACWTSGIFLEYAIIKTTSAGVSQVCPRDSPTLFNNCLLSSTKSPKKVNFMSPLLSRYELSFFNSDESESILPHIMG